jgi:2-polyprenyl-3-methyl-5-hydroxy-6-metoxy-1,4-benzoquinol methylase
MITGDDLFYSKFQKLNWYYLDDKEEYQYAKKYIKETDHVLDVGSGKGAFAKLLPNNKYVGLDFSLNAKKMAKEGGLLIHNESIQEHAKKHPGEYDIVCSFQVLEHVSDPYFFIEAQIKTLKINGLLIFSVPSEDSFLTCVVNGILNLPPHHVTRWTDTTLKKIAELFNLDLIEIHHEALQDIHKKLYMSTTIEKLFLPPKLIDMSLKRIIVNHVSKVVSIIEIYRLGKDFKPKGHSVLCVYRKR